jgi:hypothetical protein
LTVGRASSTLPAGQHRSSTLKLGYTILHVPDGCLVELCTPIG